MREIGMKHAFLKNISTMAFCLTAVMYGIQAQGQYYAQPVGYTQPYVQQVVPNQEPAGVAMVQRPATPGVSSWNAYTTSCRWNYQLPFGVVRDRCQGGYKTVVPTGADSYLGPGEWRFNAWLDQGLTYGSSRNDETFAPQAYNDMYNTYQMNQLYLTAERRVKENGYNVSLGGRVDMFYGTDYYYTQAYGWEASNVGYLTTINGVEGRLNKWNGDGDRKLAQNVADYGLSVPQAYLELYAPLAYGMKIKAGHFYSGMGMESPMAPQNFFYSHSYTSYYGLPTTLTGVQVSFNAPCGWEIFGGFDLGWNRMATKGSSGSGFGGVKWTNSCKTLGTQLMIHSGTETWTYANTSVRPRTIDSEDFNVTVLSWLTEWKINSWLSTNLEYVYGWDNKGNFPRSGIESSYWTGVTNNWFVRCTDTTTVGLRFEWFRDNPQCGRIVYSSAYDATDYNVYDVSLGVNWKPTYWCTLRPEVRWDWSDLDANPISGQKFFGDKNSQFTFGMDLLLNF